MSLDSESTPRNSRDAHSPKKSSEIAKLCRRTSMAARFDDSERVSGATPSQYEFRHSESSSFVHFFYQLASESVPCLAFYSAWKCLSLS
jgi:hypothetical protein